MASVLAPSARLVRQPSARYTNYTFVSIYGADTYVACI